jgi:hypothetical protein
MLHFQPSTPELATRALDACTDPALTLRDIAQQNNTTMEALSLWLTTPEVIDRLNDLHSITATRTRFLAAAHLPRSIDALSEVLIHAKSALRAAHSPTPSSASSTSDIPHPPSAIIQARLLETTRRAATTLVTLARSSQPALNSGTRASSPCSSSSLASPISLSWQGGCPSETSAEGVRAPDTQTAPTPSPLSIPILPNPFAHLFAIPRAPASPAPTSITPPSIAAASDFVATAESQPQAPSAPTPATLLTNFLAELSKLPIPVPAPSSDRPPLTPQEAAFSLGPGHPTLGQLETLTAYLDSLHSDLGATSASHEHWP